MTTITFHDGAFFASSVSPEDGAHLLELGWRRHARDLQLWWTRSPYLAAPLYSFCDEAAKSNLVPYAWNYATSFAKEPLEGTGCDAIRLPAGSSPYPFQIAGVQRATMRERLIIGDEMGLGKQQPIDELVLTPTGWQTIGTLRRGDSVIGSNGRRVSVLGVYPQGIKSSYRVTFSDHSHVETGPEHLWTLRYRRGGRQWADLLLTTEQLRTRPIIGTLDLSKTALYLPMLSAPVEFLTGFRVVPIEPYLLGQVISNGSTANGSISVTINAQDKDDILKRFFSTGQKIGAQQTYRGAYRITLPGLIQSISYLGLNVHSRDKFIPWRYKQAEVPARVALLQGLLDGDGSISTLHNKIVYHTISPRLADDVQELVEGLGGVASQRVYGRLHQNKPTEYQVRIRMPRGMLPFSTTRKLSRYMPGRLAHPCRTVVSVDYIRDVESVCIAVDAPDKLYATRHCILTHNTVQALAVMNLVRPLRTVIGCPTFLTRNWAHECDLWLVDPQPIVILDGAKKSLPESGIVILPYSRGHTFVDQIKAGPPIDMLIMDEAHYLKEPTSRRTKAWLGPEGLARKAKRVIALTGTPMPNNPLELYGLIEVLAPELVAGVSREKFKETYCTSIEMNLKITLKKSKREIQRPTEKIVAKGKSILNAELRASGLLVRRQKSEVLTQLPPKNIYFVHMGVDAKIESLVKEEADLYDQLQMRILTAQELIKIRGHVETVRTELGILKAPQIAAYVKYLFNEGEDRVVCFMLHRRPIEIIKEAFDKTGIDAYVLTGSESPKVRQARVDLFQAPGGRRLLIGQTTASGVGLNMTSARYGVIGELAWVPAWNEQAMDRLHRITQTRQVEIPILCYPHSCEENVIRTGARKSLDAREVLDKNLSNLLDINPATVLIAAE